MAAARAGGESAFAALDSPPAATSVELMHSGRLGSVNHLDPGRRLVMGKMLYSATMSLDGFIAAPRVTNLWLRVLR